MYLEGRSTTTAFAALVATIFIAVSSISPWILTPLAAASTTVLIMGGTGNPLSTPPDTIQYVQDFTSAAVNNFVSPSSTLATGIANEPYNAVAVITPELAAVDDATLLQSLTEGVAAPNSCVASSACAYNEDIGSSAPSPSDTFVIFGYSQSASIAMLEKRILAATYSAGEGPNVSFVVIGNTRPNGGLGARDVDGIVTYLLRGLHRNATYTPVPTDTQYATVDIALQYDGLADAPLNPLNRLADLNAYLGMVLLHPNYTDHSLSEPGVVDQGRYGVTRYYLISTPVLPLLTPLQQIPIVGSILADALDPPLRVLIESAYDRTISPGQPTPYNLLYFPDPVKTAVDFLVAIPTGWDNALEDVFGTRPFGTKRPAPYGVGGPDVDYLTSESTTSSASSSATSASSTDTGTGPTSTTTRGLGHFNLHTSSTSPTRIAGSRAPKSTSSSKSTTSSPGKSSQSGLGSSKRAS